MKILVTGGCGYIGSHTVIELLENGYEPIIVDNLCNSKAAVIDRLYKITGKRVKFYKVDLLDKEALDAVFAAEKPQAVIHFAGLKAVGESVSIPLKYYHNNITGTLILLDVMDKYNVKNIVFSSSATVYGSPESLPIKETFHLSCTNPYGRTKLFIEEILRDLYKARPDLNIAILRYFNPIGAHASGLIGEDPNDIPNNLVPYVTQVMVGKLKCVRVFGNDYNTPDGTGVRDYIHVVDLAHGHILALKKLAENCGLVTYNLGTGNGSSVLDVIHAFEQASGMKIPYVITDRRPGDIDACYADPSKAKAEIGFEAKRTIADMARDSWNWQKNNPNGITE